MPRLKWDQTGERTYEIGVNHGVLYRTTSVAYDTASVWNGLTGVTESPSGAEPTDLYADNIKYLTMRSAETFGATVECYTYPEEWAACNGEGELEAGVMFGQQTRETFGLSYRTNKGNDVQNVDYGYKLHIIYGCTASPSEKAYTTINESPEAITFSFEVSATPVAVDGLLDVNGKPLKAVASITLDSTVLSAAKMKAVEDILYGTEDEPARLPLPNELSDILKGVIDPIAIALEGDDEVGLGSVTAGQLQSNVMFNNNLKVTGTLNYVANFKEYSKNEATQKGTFLAFKVKKPEVEGIKMYVQYEGSPTTDKKEIGSDLKVVARITDKESKLTIIAEKDDKEYKTTYDLSSVYKRPSSTAIDLSKA